MGRCAGVLVLLGLLVACDAPRSAEPQELETPPAPAQTEAPSTSSTSETSSSTSTETGETDAGSESESGGTETTDEVQPRAGARLCSRPYRLSGTPGKGAGTREDAATAKAKHEAATRRLKRGLEVEIDDRPRQPWTTKLGVEFDGLDPATRHTIRIYDADDKRMKALVLDFEARDSEDLCLGLNDFYGSWQLRALRSGQRCGECVTR